MQVHAAPLPWPGTWVAHVHLMGGRVAMALAVLSPQASGDVGPMNERWPPPAGLAGPCGACHGAGSSPLFPIQPSLRPSFLSTWPVPSFMQVMQDHVELPWGNPNPYPNPYPNPVPSLLQVMQEHVELAAGQSLLTLTQTLTLPLPCALLHAGHAGPCGACHRAEPVNPDPNLTLTLTLTPTQSLTLCPPSRRSCRTMWSLPWGRAGPSTQPSKAPHPQVTVAPTGGCCGQLQGRVVRR